MIHQEKVSNLQREATDSSLVNVLTFLGLSLSDAYVFVIQDHALKQLEEALKNVLPGQQCVVFVDSKKELSWTRYFFLRRMKLNYRVECYYGLPHALKAIQLVSNDSHSLKHTLIRLYAVGELKKLYYRFKAPFLQPNVWVIST